MAGASLLALLDDITVVLDDVAVLSKIAAKKTAGVLGDDLALNAQQVAGVRAARELPVVWAVFLGSLRNKAVLVPAAMLIGALAPWLVTPLLMVGGAYLCFEGAEKLWHVWQHRGGQTTAQQDELHNALLDPNQDLVALEAQKIKGAIRTDFVLSAEIIAITLGVVAAHDLMTQAMVLSGVALVMTVGVYGLVAGIVKLDDLGLYWQRSKGVLRQRLGAAVLWFAPLLMRGLSVVGTAAMFLVGGGIVMHGLHDFSQAVAATTQHWGGLSWLAQLLANAGTGLVVGAVLVAIGHLLAHASKTLLATKDHLPVVSAAASPWHIRVLAPDQPQLKALLQEHLTDMAKHSPPDSVHALDLDQLKAPDITLWSAWDQHALVVCGALREIDATHGEIKSMRTSRTHLRRGAGAFMLQHLIDEATRRGYKRLSLETGSMAAFAPARQLYTRFGFTHCQPFADYELDAHSVYMSLAL